MPEQSQEVNLKRIDSCDLLLGYSCMLRCKMCYLWQRRRDPSELTIKEWENLVEALSKLVNSGSVRLHFGGGEPFLRDGIFDLIQFSAQRKFKTMVTSNGFLVDRRLASKISSSGLTHLSFSLDSLEAKTHDYLRGKKGSQARVLGAIQHINNLSQRPTLGINCIISALNLDSILPLARWVIDNNQISGVIFQAVIQPFDTTPDDRWYMQNVFKELWPGHIEKVQAVIDGLIELKKNGNDKISNPAAQLEAFKMYFKDPQEFLKKAACPMHGASLLINWLGQVHACGLLPNIGNIREKSIGEILSSLEAKDRKQQMRLCNRNCNNKVNCFFDQEAVCYGD